MRQGEVSFVTDGKESVAELHRHAVRLASAFRRVRDWPAVELGEVKVTPARWGGFFNVSAKVLRLEREDGRGSE